MKELCLPFAQDSKTAKQFEFWKWCFCFNRARPPEECQSLNISKHGRFWVSHRTRPFGISTLTKNSWDKDSFIHRITAAVREQSGVKYLQLIFFSWWVGVVRKDTARFVVN